MGRFQFDALPPEMAAVLRDALNWRNARDAAQDAIADAHLRELDASTITFKRWCMEQGELLTQEQPEDTPPVVTPGRDPDRKARQARIAKSHLSMVPPSKDGA